MIDWCNLMASSHKYPGLARIFAIPNGGLRTKAQAGKLKAEGAKAGVLDLMLPLPIAPYHGLFLEMKARDGRLTAEQKDWMGFLRGAGYAVEVCFSFEAARDFLVRYLKGRA